MFFMPQGSFVALCSFDLPAFTMTVFSLLLRVQKTRGFSCLFNPYPRALKTYFRSDLKQMRELPLLLLFETGSHYIAQLPWNLNLPKYWDFQCASPPLDGRGNKCKVQEGNVLAKGQIGAKLGHNPQPAPTDFYFHSSLLLNCSFICSC